jgi:ectonucleotide pyrophosphatase/phosphodiesterase family member 5
MGAMRALALLVAVLGCTAPGSAETVRPRVYLVIVDGLGADQVDAALMPRLAAAGRDGVATAARASMPTRTNPGHATLLTGVLPESHGITGNGYWDREGRAARSLDRAELLEAETLFTRAETAAPSLRTVAAFSKTKLGKLFGAVPDRQKEPDLLWVPSSRSGMAGHLVGVASDAVTMDAFLTATAKVEPDLAVVNLSEVDRSAHRDGPAGTAEARRNADAAIGRLLDDLRARGRWARSIVLVTADHGFDDVAPTSDHPDRIVRLGRRFAGEGITGLRVVGDGGTAHVYAEAVRRDAVAAGPAAVTLAWAAAVAWRDPAVAEVVARLPVDGVPAVADVHADWGLAHERAGDLLLIARPGFHFIESDDAVSSFFRGNHGSPREAAVPLVIAGGALARKPESPSSPPSGADVGATIAALLGLPAPKRFDGAPVAAGTPLALPLRDAR